MILTFIILIITILLFIWGKVRPDMVAMLSVLALFVTGVIDAQQALSGFSDSTVIMIAALFVVGAGLGETGVTTWIGVWLLRLARNSRTRLLIALMVGTAGLSAFMSNTGTVATLMPATVAAAWSAGSVPAQFLMPLAFAANTGGLLTLTGTPPNIVVADALAQADLIPFSFFEYSLIGLPLLAITIVYLKYVGQRWLPNRASGEQPIDVSASLGELSQTYALPDNVYRLRVRTGSRLVNKTLKDIGLGRDYGVAVIHIDRMANDTLNVPDSNQGDGRIPDLGPDTVIHAQDILLVKGTQEAIEQVMIVFNLALQPVDEMDSQLRTALLSKEVGLAEVLLTPRSVYIGYTIAEGQFAAKFHVQVLSIRRQDKLVDTQTTKLMFGDSLLVRGTWEAIGRLQQERRNFVVIGSPEAMARQVVGLNRHSFLAMIALVGMVVLMVTGLTPTVMAALIAAIAMVLAGCLSIEVAYRAISWSSVTLIAAMIPMSTALQVTGGAEFLANGLVNTLGVVHPLGLLVGAFLLTTSFSQVISNTATAVLVSPIVLQAALNLGISPYPVLMMVAVGASTAFLTPIGTPTNLMVMAPGDYQFNDYLKIGFPLLLIFLLISLILVPLIWPLAG